MTTAWAGPEPWDAGTWARRALRDYLRSEGDRGRGRRRRHGPPPWAGGFVPGGPHGKWAGPGGPAGPGWVGGPWRRGPRGRGDVRLAILGLLAESPMHGYQLIQEITSRSEGDWRPSPGSIYPTLSQLEDEGLVRAGDEEGRRVFTLTDTGRAQAAERRAEYNALWQRPADPDGDAVRELGALVVQVGAAAVQVASAGTDDQRRRAGELLERTRRDLYRLLAGDDETREDEP